MLSWVPVAIVTGWKVVLNVPDSLVTRPVDTLRAELLEVQSTMQLQTDAQLMTMQQTSEQLLETSRMLDRQTADKMTSQADATLANMRAQGEGVLASLTETTMIVAIVGLLITLGIMLLVAHGIASRIDALAEAANRISVGDMDQEIQVSSDDEIGKLARAFSRMQRSLAQAMKELGA